MPQLLHGSMILHSCWKGDQGRIGATEVRRLPLRQGRNLAAREFRPVVRPHGFDFPFEVWRKKFLEIHVQYSAEHVNFQIRHSTGLIFQPRKGILTHIPSEQLQLHGQPILRPALACAQLAHLRPDHVQVCSVVFDCASLAIIPLLLTRLTAYVFACFHSPNFRKLPCPASQRFKRDNQNVITRHGVFAKSSHKIMWTSSLSRRVIAA